MLTLFGAAIVGVLVAAGIAGSGLYDVSAQAEHPKAIAFLLHYVMRRSVAAHAANGATPNLDDPRLVMQGAAHFLTACAACHSAPGTPPSPMARKMMPTPPPLYAAARTFTPSQLYWIIHNGVKMTAMPGWPAPLRTDEIWALVAFIEHLPQTRPEEFKALAGMGSTVPFLDETTSAAFDIGQCSRCHGTDGRGRDGAFPNIAGLSPAYIARSLREYRAGTRQSGFMQVAAAGLSDAQIEAAAKTYAAMPRFRSGPVPAVPPPGEAVQLVTRGAPNLPACDSCHAPAARLRHPDIPPLAGQPAAYLRQQLYLYTGHIRAGTSAADAMGRIASRLTAKQIDALANYLGSP